MDPTKTRKCRFEIELEIDADHGLEDWARRIASGEETLPASRLMDSLREGYMWIAKAKFLSEKQEPLNV